MKQVTSTTRGAVAGADVGARIGLVVTTRFASKPK